MRRFHCLCGRRVFFENTRCLSCGRELAFDPAALDLRPLGAEGDGEARCRNHADHGNCNWLVEPGGELCLSCGLNEVVPNLDSAENVQLWTRVERAKKRLIYTLLRLGLPVRPREGATSLSFRVLEDRRRNPAVLEDFVLTGHAGGTITVNLAEADDAERDAVRRLMQERYRTVLGHLRHEAGHYYFPRLTARAADLEECRRVFGDERADYEAALRVHYERGASGAWPETFVSAYASAHPMEDFAETFAHYLHIVDALETAEAEGFVPAGHPPGWIDAWIALALALNEMNRSLGLEDPYPFVLTEPITRKLELIDRLVRPAA